MIGAALLVLVLVIAAAIRFHDRGMRGWSVLCGALAGVAIAVCAVFMHEPETETDYCTPATHAREAILACNMLPHCQHGVEDLAQAAHWSRKCAAQQVGK